ncbi:wall-associated receptor kinase-like 1 [Chenopodium quinoa]|uniref:wall-associated receptor kinase-like 1 n=1 Tax=Chenopodium quinoa TaxID=63459 RepID=UPI000B791BE3|nr:wall-associated receptor kinase-like 1 [Chenopodium quinoa]
MEKTKGAGRSDNRSRNKIHISTLHNADVPFSVSSAGMLSTAANSIILPSILCQAWLSRILRIQFRHGINGTLYQHIHDANGDFHVTWKMRLQMAAESADAIAYLHSSSSAPIYHRDIKSANILLDAKFRAKVSDFGASRAIDIEQTHVTTCVIGTYGYLDPEYFQSNVFTEKSDVYSFGVVLVELITGKKPICPTNDGGWISLAVEFLFHMENSRLFDILDPRILDEGKKEEFVAVAKLARQCVKMNGKERPTMKEIAIVLDEIRSSHVSYSMEPNSMVGKEVMMELSDKHVGSSSTSSFFPGVDTDASSTMVQRAMAHTL